MNLQTFNVYMYIPTLYDISSYKSRPLLDSRENGQHPPVILHTVFAVKIND